MSTLSPRPSYHVNEMMFKVYTSPWMSPVLWYVGAHAVNDTPVYQSSLNSLIPGLHVLDLNVYLTVCTLYQKKFNFVYTVFIKLGLNVALPHTIRAYRDKPRKKARVRNNMKRTATNRNKLREDIALGSLTTVELGP